MVTVVKKKHLQIEADIRRPAVPVYQFTT